MIPLRHSVGRFKRLTPLTVGLILTLHLAAATTAEEVTVQNDSVGDFDTAVIVGDFIPGEEAAAWLTSPCDGAIVAAQILWLSIDPDALPTLEENIWIRESGPFPTPGATLLQLEGPVMTPGFMNVFRYVDEAQQIPINVPVSSGETFVVSLEFANPTDILNGTPSVVRDIDGCQPGRNALFAIPGNWLNFCIFLQGDLVIRAVVDCADATGACCLDSGDCIDGVSSDECTAQGGHYEGDNTDCDSTTCRQACCLPTFCDDVTVDFCLGAGGDPQGAGSECESTNCLPIGACCMPDGTCADMSPEDCEAQGGTFQGDGVLCSDIECPEPFGACCVGENCKVMTETRCDNFPNSTWGGPGTDCEDTNGNGVPDACEQCSNPHDADADCDVDLSDYSAFLECRTGPSVPWTDPQCGCFDGDGDGDIDLIDWGFFQVAFTGPGPGCPP